MELVDRKKTPYVKVKNARTGKSRMMPMSLALKGHSVNAFVKVGVSVCICLFGCCLLVFVLLLAYSQVPYT